MLNINSSVYAFKANFAVIYDNNGDNLVDRGYVTRLHDDYIEMFSLISKSKNWYRRDRVVLASKITVK